MTLLELCGFIELSPFFLFLGDKKLWSSKKVNTRLYVMYSTGPGHRMNLAALACTEKYRKSLLTS